MLSKIRSLVFLSMSSVIFMMVTFPTAFTIRADAASTNSISQVFITEINTDLTSAGTGSVPVLLLTNENIDWVGPQILSLTLDNGAKWNTGTTGPAISQVPISQAISASPSALGYLVGTQFATNISATAVRVSDVLLEVSIPTGAGLFWDANDCIYIPMAVTLGNTVGEYQVTVSGTEGQITDGTYTYATTDTVVPPFLDKLEYFFDADNRLTEIRISTGSIIQYLYDLNGNLLRTVRN